MKLSEADRMADLHLSKVDPLLLKPLEEDAIASLVKKIIPPDKSPKYMDHALATLKSCKTFIKREMWRLYFRDDPAMNKYIKPLEDAWNDRIRTPEDIEEREKEFHRRQLIWSAHNHDCDEGARFLSDCDKFGSHNKIDLEEQVARNIKDRLVSSRSDNKDVKAENDEKRKVEKFRILYFEIYQGRTPRF